jgi:hypothetical protein
MRLLEDGGVCNPQERLITWDVQGPVGPQGPPGPAGASSPLVVDAGGTALGIYLGSQTLMSVSGHQFNLLVLRDGFSSPSFGAIFQYLTPDCSGLRYGNALGAGVVPNGIVLGQAAWFPDYTGQSVTVQAGGTIYNQQTTSAGPVGPCSPSQIFSTTTFLPWSSVSVGAFVPPFTLTN